MNYQLFFNNLGQFENANTEDGRSIPYYPLNPSHTDPNSELTIAFLTAVTAGMVDISDRPATPQPQEPDWTGLVGTFTFPGNPLYLAIVTKVGECPYLVRDHWENFKEIVTNLRNTEALAAGVEHLAGLLSAANQPLNTEEITDWNALVEQFNFPDSCKLQAV